MAAAEPDADGNEACRQRWTSKGDYLAGVTERYGSLSATGVAKETTFGTPVAAADFLPMTGNTMEVDPGWFSPATMMGVRDAQVFSLHGEQKITGTVEGPLFPTNGITMLAAAIGADTVTGATAPYTHTLAEAVALHSLTVEKNIGGFQSLQFAGCKVGKLTIKATAGNEAATIAADMTGQSAAILTTPTAITVVNESPFTFANASVTLMSGARAEVTSIQVEVENGLKETYVFNGQHGPGFITPVTLKCTGTIDLVFDSLNDATYGDYANMVANTQGALALNLSQGAAASIDINLAKVALSKYSNNLKVADVITAALTFEATYDIANTKTLSVVVTNGEATAY